MEAVDKSSRRRTATREELDRWRSLPAAQVALVISTYAKQDPTYVPSADHRTQRWNVEFGGSPYELLTTGSKFWDTRAGVGGGGAVDLVIYVLGCKFRDAVTHLREHGL